MRAWTVSLNVLRIVYGLLWFSLPVSLLLGVPMPTQPTQAATDFWTAIEATGFIVPLLAVTYLGSTPAMS